MRYKAEKDFNRSAVQKEILHLGSKGEIELFTLSGRYDVVVTYKQSSNSNKAKKCFIKYGSVYYLYIYDKKAKTCVDCSSINSIGNLVNYIRHAV